ncbi:MAG: nicotinate-nucleotide adenylyltransferase [Gammaproteobacteria bacterium]|nr:nicotinate-nucleotide adenylyltransferase [Gammaproteobacteria bacterium]
MTQHAGTGAVGLFGGTFDPVHFGHLRPALECLVALGLPELRLIPSAMPPHRAAPVASPEQRLAMLRLAAADQPGFVVDARELQRPGPSYTVDTLRELRAELGDARPLCLLLGTDAFLGLPSWHHWQALPELAHLVVMHRPGFPREALAERADEAVRALLAARQLASPTDLHGRPAGGIWLQPVTALDISATAIRASIGAGGSARYLLPDAVWRYIEQNGLYRKV